MRREELEQGTKRDCEKISEGRGGAQLRSIGEQIHTKKYGLLLILEARNTGTVWSVPALLSDVSFAERKTQACVLCCVFRSRGRNTQPGYSIWGSGIHLRWARFVLISNRDWNQPSFSLLFTVECCKKTHTRTHTHTHIKRERERVLLETTSEYSCHVRTRLPRSAIKRG